MSSTSNESSSAVRRGRKTRMNTETVAPRLIGSSALFGLSIVESIHCVVDGEPIEVRRTWKERLLSWPWRPIQRTKTVISKVPYQGGYQMGNKIIMHPEIAARLCAELDGPNAKLSRAAESQKGNE